MRSVAASAPPSACPDARRIVVSESTGNAFRLACRSWSCDHCSKNKWLAARVMFERGILAAFARGERVRFMTLTDGTKHGSMNVKDLSNAWERLAKVLRRGGPPIPRPLKGSGAEAQERWRRQCRARTSLLSEYVMVLEVGPRGGRLHAHVIFTGGSRRQRWRGRAGTFADGRL